MASLFPPLRNAHEGKTNKGSGFSSGKERERKKERGEKKEREMRNSGARLCPPFVPSGIFFLGFCVQFCGSLPLELLVATLSQQRNGFILRRNFTVTRYEECFRLKRSLYPRINLAYFLNADYAHLNTFKIIFFFWFI